MHGWRPRPRSWASPARPHEAPGLPRDRNLSGVEWPGDVPEHWEVKRLKTSATGCLSNVDKVSTEDEMPERLCDYTDVYCYPTISRPTWV